MKNLLIRSWWRAVLVSLAIVLLSGSIAYAAYYGVSKSLAATVAVAEVITLPSDAIGVYSDAAGTANVTSLNFGRVAPWGYGYTSVTVYVKNHSNTVGPEPVKLFISAYGQNFGYGSVNVDIVYNPATGSGEYPSLLPGEIKPVKINLWVNSNAPAGSHNFTVVIDGKAATAPDVMPPMVTPPMPTTPIVVTPLLSPPAELANIQAAVVSMMVDNNLATLPTPVSATANRTRNMGAFPDTSALGVGLKYKDILGNIYTGNDKAGFFLYQHDGIADNATGSLTNYFVANQTVYWYTADANGTVTQYLTAP